MVSVCIVAFNEENNLSDIFSDLLDQTYPHADTELVLVDNRSSDGTYEVLCRFRDEHLGEYSDIKVLKNQASSVLSSGLNMAMDAFCGDVYVRVDAHASLDRSFLEETVACLEGTYTGIKENVCGGMRPTYTTGTGGMSALLLAAEQSRFGASAASYRGTPERCYVDSVFHAAYRREVVERVGHFNERLFRTEDNEYNRRVYDAGYKICFEPRIKSAQQIRPTLSKMLKQKNQNGYWIGYTLGVCPRCLGVFHFVPFAFLSAVIITSLLGVLGFGVLAALMWGAYGLCSIIFTAKAMMDAPKLSPYLLLLPVIFLLIHIWYGAGTYAGIFKMLADKVKNKDRA